MSPLFSYHSKEGRRGEEEAKKMTLTTFSYQGLIYQILALRNFIIYLCWNGKGK